MIAHSVFYTGLLHPVISPPVFTTKSGGIFLGSMPIARLIQRLPSWTIGSELPVSW